MLGQRNDYFTGRDSVLEALHGELARKGCAALSGLGGVGKTQIATEYAYRYRPEYDAVFWVNAADPSHLTHSFIQMAQLLDLPESRSKDQNEAVDAVRRYLENAVDWLLVYDNADEPRIVKEFLPRVRSGHVVITSRAQVLDMLGIAKPIDVSEMTATEALAFLLRRTGREDTDVAERSSAEALVEELGYLPLALEQAAAFIVAKQSRFQSYLEAYHRHRLSLLDRGHPAIGDSAKSVTTTWTIAFENMAGEPVSADILAVSAFLYSDDIPLELVRCGASQLGPEIGAALVDSEDELRLDEVLEPLTRYSLIHRDIAGRTFTVHRLVQDVTKARMAPEEQRLWGERAIRALNTVFPSAEYEQWPLCERLLPHIRVIADGVGTELPPCVEAADLVTNAGRYLFRRGQYAEAESMHAKALELRESLFGPRDPAVASSLNNLANAYFGQARYEESEALHERALAIREETLGWEHPDVTMSLNNVANVYSVRGKFAEAEALHLRSIAIKEAMLGPEHSETALSLDNLGIVYYEQGKYAEAESMHRRALIVREKALGEEHPVVAVSLNGLASVYRSQGEYARAEPLYRRALEIHEKSLGPDHDRVAEILNNLANVYRHQGKFSEAEPLCKRALAISERALGTEHPDTAKILNELACLYYEKGENEEADVRHRRALEIVEKALGCDHPMMAQLREDFAYSDPRRAARGLRGKNALTPREREVAEHVAAGRSNRAIADALSLSERTIESHVASTLAKLQMHSRGEIAAYVFRESASVQPEVKVP